MAAVEGDTVTLSPWPHADVHPLAAQIQAWREAQLEEDEEFEFKYEDSPFQVCRHCALYMHLCNVLYVALPGSQGQGPAGVVVHCCAACGVPLRQLALLYSSLHVFPCVANSALTHT